MTESHQAEIERRGLSVTFAIDSGLRTIADNEARALGFEACIPVNQRNQGLQGICFEFRAFPAIEEGAEPSPVIYRLKPDNRFVIGESQAKYISRVGDPARCYYPAMTEPDFRKHTAINVLITEGEFKAIALAQHICPIASRKSCAIGLVGVNGGWQRDSITVQLPDGTREKRKEGHAHLVPDLEEWEWKKRVVYVVFDSDVGTKKHAEAFKRGSRQGAMGAEHTLAQLLRSKGADVRIVQIPHGIDGTKYGIDDYVLNYGAAAALKLIYNNWCLERNIDEILYKAQGANVRIESACDLVESAPPRPAFAIEGILPEQGLMILAGAPGVGKSMLALNACHSIAHGSPWLGTYATTKGRAIYIQTEMPRWALAERVRHFGEIPEGLLLWTPERMHLNFWEPDGFQKRRETGNRELVMAMVDAIQRHAASFVVFDPFSDLHSLSETDREGMRHVFEVLRQIITATRASVCIVAHNRKTGGRQGSYEGADDILGSNVISAKADATLSIYAHKRSDETYRWKLVFTKLRHAEELKPAEIIRVKDSLLWYCEEWRDADTIGERGSEILECVRVRFSGAATAKEIMRQTEIPSSAFYRHIHQLERAKAIEKRGNIYYFMAQHEKSTYGDSEK